MTTLKNFTAEDVVAFRKEWGMSQTELATRLGLSRPTLVKIEKGARQLKRNERERLREIFGIVQETDMSGSDSDVRVSVPQQNIEKFKQVLLYILEKTAGKPNVGMTVLYKLLYFIDFDYYEKYEEQLMGLKYFKNHFGPTPRAFFRVVEEMKRSGQLEEVKSKHFQFDQRKFLPHIHPDVSKLSGREIKMIDDVLARYSDKSAKELSALSHEDTPWKVAEDGEDIEYDHVFYRNEKLSVREYEAL